MEEEEERLTMTWLRALWHLKSVSSDANFHPFAVSQHCDQDRPGDASALEAFQALSKLHCPWRHSC